MLDWKDRHIEIEKKFIKLKYFDTASITNSTKNVNISYVSTNKIPTVN